MSNLLPCPFCGADAAELHENPHADMAWVACIICGLEAPTETGVQAEQAVDYWNSRPGASSQAEIERLTAALCAAAEVLENYADPSGYRDTYDEEYEESDQHPGLLAADAAKAARAALGSKE